MARRKQAAGNMDDLIVSRQEKVAEKKILEAEIAKLSSQIARAMITKDIYEYKVAGYSAALITDATYTKFDMEKMKRYLVEHKVPAKVIANAVKHATETDTKKPHVRISGGPEE